jgi:hypothetical protein
MRRARGWCQGSAPSDSVTSWETTCSRVEDSASHATPFFDRPTERTRQSAYGSVYSGRLFFEIWKQGMGYDERWASSVQVGGKTPHLNPLPQGARRQAGGGPQYVKLPNEANFWRCWRLWMWLTDRGLGGVLGQFVTWLRFAGIGFVWGGGALPVTKSGSNWRVSVICQGLRVDPSDAALSVAGSISRIRHSTR